jgi:membrane protein DedA with SNARE-associated domain
VTLLLLAVATFLSEDLTCIAAGVLVHRGDLRLVPAIVACAAGVFAGDLGLWACGRAAGARALRWQRVAAVIPSDSVERFRRWFASRACGAIFASRFTPGTRLPLYVAAGAAGSSLSQFAGWSFLAVFAWTPLLVGATAVFGDRAAAPLRAWLSGPHAVLLVSTGIWLAGWRSARRLCSLRGRQELSARMARIWCWEFWPMWIFYAPVAIWTAWLALRHGGYRTLTAANPGMPDGGVVGESKFLILRRLPAEWTIPAALISPGDDASRVRTLTDAMHESGWAFPIVLKPDVGERGTGVRLIGDAQAAAAYVRASAGAIVAQPYHPGPYEAGVFYYRQPGEARGTILAITDKHFPVVTGDGGSTLEQLIWAHPRYRMQARTFLARLGEQARRVPSAGERVRLAVAGNHAQGTMFKDGASLITPELELRIDAIARTYPGFHIGRFDIRYANRDAFMRGDDLAIVELNGATAECTNIYDPERSLRSAYGQLFIQWRLVFEIGAANRRAGRQAASNTRLLGLLRAHLAASSPFPVSD